MRKISLYKITNLLNDKVYIGQSINPKRRWSDHKWQANHKQEQYIHRAISKYGVDNFQFEIISECILLEDANETEKQLIIQYNSRNSEQGYNIAPGGETPWNLGLPKEMNPLTGVPRSEETNKKISKGNLGKIMPPCSDERKKKLSEMYTGRSLSDEQIEKISIANTGKIRSEESKRKMSEAQSGEKHRLFGKHQTEETRLKISDAISGRIISEETKNKMSKAKADIKMSDETKLKMSRSHHGKTSYRKFSIDKELEICEFIKSGATNKEASVKYDCSIVTIRNIIKRNNNAYSK